MASNNKLGFKLLLVFLAHFIILSLYPKCTSTKSIIRGIYCNGRENDLTVKITRTQFICIRGLFDTIAICNYRIISDHFIEVFNTDPNYIVQKNMNIFYHDILEDSIKISFSIPYCDKGILRIKMKDEDNNELSLNCFQGHNTVSFPGKYFKSSINVLIEPSHLSDIVLIDNEYNGITHINIFIPITLLPQKHYYISIPTIKDNYWRNYYTPGCFIRIDRDTLIWNSHLFFRKL